MPERNLARTTLILAQSQVVRGLREGLIVRALAWPALVTALAMMGAIGAAATWYASNSIAVSDPALAEELRDEGLQVVVAEDPEAALDGGLVDRAAWREDGRWMLVTEFGGALTLKAEAALRRRSPGAAWVIEPLPRNDRDQRTSPATRLMVGILAALFTLYGVVFGAGGLARDRDDGTLEAELSLPVPFVVHGAARILAGSLTLAVGFVVSVLLLHGLIGVDRAGPWCWVGSLAGVGGCALGFGWMSVSGRSESLSGPLVRGMTVSMALLFLGWSQPAIGRHLPIASIGALVGGFGPSAVAALVAVGMGAAACWLFGRGVR